jgi:hypothetical protein
MKPPIIAVKELNFVVSAALVKTAARRYFLRVTRNARLLILPLLLVGIYLLYCFYMSLGQNDPDLWFYPIPAIVVALVIVQHAWIYFKIRSNMCRNIGKSVTIRLHNCGMNVRNNDSQTETEFSWKDSTRLWKCAEVWFVLFRFPKVFNCTIPADVLDAEAMAFIENAFRMRYSG